MWLRPVLLLGFGGGLPCDCGPCKAVPSPADSRHRRVSGHVGCCGCRGAWSAVAAASHGLRVRRRHGTAATRHRTRGATATIGGPGFRGRGLAGRSLTLRVWRLFVRWCAGAAVLWWGGHAALRSRNSRAAATWSEVGRSASARSARVQETLRQRSAPRAVTAPMSRPRSRRAVTFLGKPNSRRRMGPGACALVSQPCLLPALYRSAAGLVDPGSDCRGGFWVGRCPIGTSR